MVGPLGLEPRTGIISQCNEYTLTYCFLRFIACLWRIAIYAAIANKIYSPTYQITETEAPQSLKPKRTFSAYLPVKKQKYEMLFEGHTPQTAQSPLTNHTHLFA